MPKKNPYAEIEEKENPYAAIEAEANKRLKEQGSVMAEFPEFLGGAYKNKQGQGLPGLASSGMKPIPHCLVWAQMLPAA